MKYLTHILALFLFAGFLSAQKNIPHVKVDKNGIMHYTDSQKEASFFGVNYTLPFAHAYRAMNYLGVDHKEAIDKDVYHFARLGFNAYRIHVWEVEISDNQGNLINNDHLHLFDYLIAKLKERNIKIVITAMTQFGNGYPERNEPTGSFTYLYEKCKINDDLKAQEAQERYLAQLANHVNPYTKLSYKNDPDIIAFEINNEPCHQGTPRQTKEYINRMVKALKKTGFKKPIFYNVSHNLDHVESYYSANIQGTTYQWYPMGLVAGKTREGNFLPFVDQYNIPFSNVKGFQNKAKLVYEYDPADNLYGYLHPAIVRSFRAAGFQWITQFAYDPIDMAQYNTEYQTHYLNLAFTPQKAISMKIAAEVAYSIPLNKSYGKYPVDTVFEDFRVSYLQNLSEMNSGEKFYHSNHTSTSPKSLHMLKSVAGYGNSKIVEYNGKGAYFLDKLEDGVWRLEVMPDVYLVTDPFQKTSLKNEVAKIVWNQHDFTLNLPNLSEVFSIKGVNSGNSFISKSNSGKISNLTPGVYILKRDEIQPEKNWDANTKWENILLGEYVAPKSNIGDCDVIHKPRQQIEKGDKLIIEAYVLSSQKPDSVLVYSDRISFWRQNNPYLKMKNTEGSLYSVKVPENELGPVYRYNIVVFLKGKPYTFPQGVQGMPLDWDYTKYDYYTTKNMGVNDPVVLFEADDDARDLESYILPKWHLIEREIIENNPHEKSFLSVKFLSDEESPTFYLQKYIKDKISGRTKSLKSSSHICLNIKHQSQGLRVGFVTNTGFTYLRKLNPTDGVVKIPINSLQQTKTVLLPQSYPVFMNQYFQPESTIPFRIQDVEKLIFTIDGVKNQSETIRIGTIWIGE